MKKLRYVVRRGSATDTVLTPHVYKDNHFVVSLSRYEKEYERVKDEAALLDWVAKGYSVRMSNPDVKSHRSPSLISPNLIEIYEP